MPSKLRTRQHRFHAKLSPIQHHTKEVHERAGDQKAGLHRNRSRTRRDSQNEQGPVGNMIRESDDIWVQLHARDNTETENAVITVGGSTSRIGPQTSSSVRLFLYCLGMSTYDVSDGIETEISGLRYVCEHGK